MRKLISLFLVLFMIFSLTGTAFANDGSPVSSFCISIYDCICGQDPQDNLPVGYISPNWEETEDDNYDPAEFTEPMMWVSSIDDAGTPEPLTTAFVGGRSYTALVTLKAKDGYYFDENTRVLTEDKETYDNYECEVVKRDRDTITVLVEVTAKHDWDDAKEVVVKETCSSEGSVKKVCAVDPSHTETVVREIDPDAHVWGEWTVIEEATKTTEGKRVHTCTLCQTEEEETIPVFTYPYTPVYEPNTSWTMAATVAWRADQTALDTAKETVRPATAFVWLDKDLKVYDRNHDLISDDIDAYIDSTVSGMIPAFYISDQDTAASLKKWLPSSGLLDCFVVSTPENKDFVKDVADLLHIRGMLDYTAVTDPAREDLVDMAASTNGAHGKVIILSGQAATRENVRLLQSLASTVWVLTPSDTNSLLTAYTNGVNGVVVNDYAAALKAEELFRDDAPSLLRIPFIIGHRGDPSTFVENTLDSAKGAAEEGADSIENDIHLSTDGKLFIYHDDVANGILGLRDPEDPYESVYVEDFSLAQLKDKVFDWEDILANNEVSPDNSRYGTFYGQDENKEYTVPTFEEYLTEFKGTGIVHDTEIKSENTEIIPVFKAVVDQYDAWDQVFSVSFNKPILDELYKSYPEISIGALGLGTATDVKYQNYDEISEKEGPEEALKQLYSEIDQWNATYNSCYNLGLGHDMISAGRHRGLTVWPWTYTLGDAEGFARDYLFGVAGLTCDYPWIASDYVTEITANDVTAASVSEILKPNGITQKGEVKLLNDAVLVKVESIDRNHDLMIWRYKAELTADTQILGNYYLYSNPFVYTIKSGNKASSSGSASLLTQYTIKIASDKEAEGTVTANTEKAKKGDVVTVAVTPNEGYQLLELTAANQNGKAIQVERIEENTYRFVMPASEVTLTPKFEKTDHNNHTDVSKRFIDVPEQIWYHDAVQWAADNGIMDGVSADTFAPNDPVTRAMIVTILYRLEGRPAVSDTSLFDDVTKGQWYTGAVIWANANGIVGGYGDGRFGPKDNITREQFAAILYRYSAFKSCDTSGTADLSAYTDASEISDWATEAMQWANAQGLITGRTATTLVPWGEATRAEAAVILMRYVGNAT